MRNDEQIKEFVIQQRRIRKKLLSGNQTITEERMNHGKYVIIGFGENLYGEKSLRIIFHMIKIFGKNATEESEDGYYHNYLMVSDIPDYKYDKETWYK